MIKLIFGIGLIACSTLSIFLAWPPKSFGPLIFFALIPYLFLTDLINTSYKGIKAYLLNFIGLIIILLTSGFFINNNAWGQYTESVNSGLIVSYLPIAIICSLHCLFKNKFNGFIFFSFSWAAIEIVQFNWELNSPLMTLGNSLSYFPELIQHYSIWGVIGGTIHILFINFWFYLLISKRNKQVNLNKQLIAGILLFIPLILSVITFTIPSKNEKKITVGLGLLHFEHFTEYFSKHPEELVHRYNELRLDAFDSTDLVILPESAIVDGGWIENLTSGQPHLFDSLFPGKEIVFGSHMFSIASNFDNEDPEIRYDKFSKVKFHTHNNVVHRKKGNIYKIRSKEKFVPFHEKIPYPSFLKSISRQLTKHYSPTYLSKYKRSEMNSFTSDISVKFSPLMCFESYFSNMVAKNMGQDLTIILSNESWNESLGGKVQYFHYMVPKAIESGLPLVKVSNNGISGYIDPKGVIKNQFMPNDKGLKTMNILLNGSGSFYASVQNLINYLIFTVLAIALFFNFIRS